MKGEDIGKKYKDEDGNEFELISFCDEPTVTFKDSKGENTTFSQHSILMKQLTPVVKTLSDKIKTVNIFEDVEIDELSRNYKIKPKIVIHRKCEKCGMTGFTESAHILSKRLARIIAIRQTKPPETSRVRFIGAIS